MLTPEEQLNSAMQGLEQSQQAPVLQSSMLNRGYEQVGMGAAAGIAQIPTVANTGAAVGLGVVGMLSTSARFDRALGFLDPFTGAMGRHMVGKTIARRLVGALPGGAFMIGAQMAASFATNRMVEGQQEYVAARQLLRELPMMAGGLSPVSILGSSSQPSLNNLSTSSAVVNRFASSINAIGAGAGMDTAMTRNTLSSMAQNGQIDTASVESVSRSFREGLQTLQRLQKVLQTDLQTASTVYSTMRAGGLSNDQAIAGLRRSGALSAMSGVGLAGVSQLTSSGSQTSIASGMSALLGSNVAMNSLSSAALLQNNGLITPAYMQRAGGSIENVASRMTELQLGIGSSMGAQALMYGMYNPDGSMRSNSRLFSASRLQASSSFLRDLNPYEMADMQEGLVRGQASVVLGRVSAIRANARNSTQADRRQFEFLSSLGIEDPTEQRVYLDSLRNQGAAQFTAAMQETRNTLITSTDPNSAMRTEMLKFSDIVNMVTHGMTTNLRTFGRSMLRASEEVIRDLTEGSRMAVHLNTSGATIASVQQARNDILSGAGAASVMPLQEYTNQLSQRSLQRLLQGSNFTGVRVNEDVRSRLPTLARAFVSLAVDLPQRIRTSLVGIGQAAYGSELPYNMTYGGGAQNFTDVARRLGYLGESSAGGEEITEEEILGVLARSAGERYNPETASLVRADSAQVDRIIARRGELINDVGNQVAQGLLDRGRVRLNPNMSLLGNAFDFLGSRTGLRSITGNMLTAMNAWGEAQGEAFQERTASAFQNPSVRGLLSIPDDFFGTFRRIAAKNLGMLTVGVAHAGLSVADLGIFAFDSATEPIVSSVNAALGQENDTTLSESVITAMQHNPSEQGHILNRYAQALFPGKNYSQLSDQEQANLDEVIIRTRPDLARALRLDSAGGMSDEQFAVFATGTEFTNTLASVFSGNRSVDSVDSVESSGQNFLNAGRISGRNIPVDELEQDSDYYVGRFQAMSLVARHGDNFGAAVNEVVGSINAGTNTYGNLASENAALISLASLSMPASNYADQNINKDELVARTEQLLRESGMSEDDLVARMAHIRAQVSSGPDVTYGEIERERENIRAANQEDLAATAEDLVIQQRNQGMAAFVAARNTVNEQNVEYLRTQYRDDITNLIATDPVLSAILGANVPDENNDIFSIVANNEDAASIFEARIAQARADRREAADRGDTAAGARLDAQISALEMARSLSGAGGESFTEIMTAFSMREMFNEEGRITEEGVASAGRFVSLPGVSSMVSLLSDTGSVTDAQRESFREGLTQAGFIVDGEIAAPLRQFAESEGLILPTDTEEALKTFEDELRNDTNMAQQLIENIVQAGSGVVSASTQEANDQEEMRRLVRTMNDEVLPPLIAVLADSEYGLRVNQQISSENS